MPDDHLSWRKKECCILQSQYISIKKGEFSHALQFGDSEVREVEQLKHSVPGSCPQQSWSEVDSTQCSCSTSACALDVVEDMCNYILMATPTRAGLSPAFKHHPLNVCLLPPYHHHHHPGCRKGTARFSSPVHSKTFFFTVSDPTAKETDVSSACFM